MIRLDLRAAAEASRWRSSPISISWLRPGIIGRCGLDHSAPQPVPTTSTSAPALGPAAPSSTAVGQTTVASTIAPPIDPAVEQAVKKGVHDFFAAYMACGQAPTQCHPSDFHSSRGTAVGQGTVYFQGLAARG